MEKHMSDKRDILEALIGSRFANKDEIVIALNKFGFKRASLGDIYEPEEATGDYKINGSFDGVTNFTIYCLKTRQNGIYVTETIFA
jgi:hypothetical protein